MIIKEEKLGDFKGKEGDIHISKIGDLIRIEWIEKGVPMVQIIKSKDTNIAIYGNS